MSGNKRCFLCTQKAYFPLILFTYLNPCLRALLFAKIIPPPDRCDISTCWLNSNFYYTGVLWTGDDKGHRVCIWYADNTNVHKRCSLWIECPFYYHQPSQMSFPKIRQYMQLARQHVKTSAQELHIWLLHQQDYLWLATQTARTTTCKTKTFWQKLSQSVSGELINTLVILTLDLTAVHWRSHHEWAIAHLWWCLALRKRVLFRD